MTLSIGEIEFKTHTFEGIESIMEEFSSDAFLALSSLERNERVNRKLYELIESAPDESYLLRETVDYLARITRAEVLDGTYNLTAFERWLNQLSDLNYEKNRLIRGKIIGKYLPRDEYNRLFPISQNKVHPGTHTVTAHNPPDLDSLTGSFLGWLDAFGCRVGSTLTVWNVPLGKPGPVASRIFTQIFTDEIFYRVAKQKTLISHVAMDIVQQDRLIKATGENSIRELNHNRYQYHIIHVDKDGFFIGDWRVSDVDSVAQVQRLLNMAMHAYEKEMVFGLTELFGRDQFKLDECRLLIEELLNKAVAEFNMQSYSLSQEQTEQLDLYIKKVLGVEDGFLCSIGRFFERMDQLAGCHFSTYTAELMKLLNEEQYDNDLISDHLTSELFSTFNRAYQVLIDCTKILRSYLDRLDVAMAIKTEVLGFRPTLVGTKAEIHEIRSKIKNHRHLTVVFSDKDGRNVPVGVIHRNDLEQDIQGTVSFRDFCNYDEIKLHDYLEVISAIDHHKTTVSSQSAMVLNVADVQSSNVLSAERYFEINDRYSTRGQSADSIEEQIQEINKLKEPAPKDDRILERLIRKRSALRNLKKRGKHFISPERELHDYLLCVNAIMDDTDLLNKCGWRDLLTLAELLNRIKSLQEKRETEIIDFSDVDLERRSLKKCIREMLKNEELYSFYKVVYDHRETVVADLISSVKVSEDTRFFEDRKIQNDSCSISQFKLFPRNWDDLRSNYDNILSNWTNQNGQVRRKSSNVDFFLHMISTIPGAIEAYEGKPPSGDDYDEFWLSGIPEADESISRMRQFLTSLLHSPRHQGRQFETHIVGPNAEHLPTFQRIIRDTVHDREINFREIKDLKATVMVFRFPQGTMNSRKADITPFLPQ